MFVDEFVKVRERKPDDPTDAGRPLLECSDARWKEAQRYERRTWMELHRGMSDDRNAEHAVAFDGYRALQYSACLSAVEIGCGPFTNMRLIAPVVGTLRSVRLVDPLVNDYLSHPHCAYPGGRVAGVPCQIDARGIEEFRTTGRRYDLVVSVNVAEHCRKFDLGWLEFMVSVGGYLVVGERVYCTSRVDEHVETHYDAGHPLRLTSSDWTAMRSNPRMQVLHYREEDGGDGGFSTLRYLIGRIGA